MRLMDVYNTLFDKQEDVTAKLIKDTILGKTHSHSLLSLFKEHNDKMKALIGMY